MIACFLSAYTPVSGRSCLSSSAILPNFLRRWFTPDLPTGGSKASPSSFNVASGLASLNSAISLRLSGRLSNPALSLMYMISSICLTAADTVLLILAVSQFTCRFTLPRISLRMRMFSSSIRATGASITFKISTIWLPYQRRRALCLPS